jgi:hypothetical protein
MLQIIAFVVLIIYKIISYFVVTNCYFGSVPVVKGDFLVLMSTPNHILTYIMGTRGSHSGDKATGT